MIDPITKYMLESYDNIVEGYDLQCQECGRVIAIVKDGSGKLECCNKRMFVMGSNPQPPPGEEVESKIGESEFVGDIREDLSSADPTSKEQKDMEEGLRKILGREVVKPDFQVKPGDVDFSPYNQADAQKKVEAERDKKEKVKESEFVKDIKEDLETAIEMCGKDHGDDHDHESEKKSKKKVTEEGKVSKILHKANPQYWDRRSELVSQRKVGLGARKAHDAAAKDTYNIDWQNKTITQPATAVQRRTQVDYKKGDPLHGYLQKRTARAGRKRRELQKASQQTGYRAPAAART